MTIVSTEAMPLPAVSALTDQASARGARGAQTPGGPAAAPKEGARGRAAGAERAAASGRAAEVAKAAQLPEFRRYELAFRLDQELNRVVVQVIDAKTRTVVRTIPPEQLTRALKHLRATRGVLLDREG